jgi:hypothetical protein
VQLCIGQAEALVSTFAFVILAMEATAFRGSMMLQSRPDRRCFWVQFDWAHTVGFDRRARFTFLAPVRLQDSSSSSSSSALTTTQRRTAAHVDKLRMMLPACHTRNESPSSRKIEKTIERVHALVPNPAKLAHVAAAKIAGVGDLGNGPLGKRSARLLRRWRKVESSS